MSDPKTYYGPWFETIPTDAPNGSLWDAVYILHDGSSIECQIVAFNGCLIDEDMITVDGGDIARARRVWPPGSFLPEPRPLVVNGKVRDLNGADGWMFMRGTADGVLTRPSWYLVTPEDNSDFYRFTPARHVDSLLYPVQFFNGALVPVPWPDSGCTTE